MRRYRTRRPSGASIHAQTTFMAKAFGEKPSRVDANHAELVTHAEALGGHIIRIGPLDGWCWNPRTLHYRPFEIKTPEREGLEHEYTPQQKRFFRWCHQHNAIWWVWRNKLDVEACLGARRSA